MSSSCKIIENDDKISATGYLFRDKSDAIESAALAMLDLLLYRYSIKSTLHNDLVFVEDWPAYHYISGNLNATSSSLLDIAGNVSSLIYGMDDSGRLFQAEESRISSEIAPSCDAASSVSLDVILNDCSSELRSTYQFLSANISEHLERVRWRCQSHRFYRRGHYEALHKSHKAGRQRRVPKSDRRSYCYLLLLPLLSTAPAMAAAVWESVKGRPKSAAKPSRQALALLAGDDDGRVQKGYVPIVLVGDGEGGSEERRIMVRVEMLKEPSMAAVLEMAAQQFGYGQRGVLRIPCGADRFQQIVSARHAPLDR